MGHLDQLDKDYGSKGFKVVAISAADRASIDGFVDKTQAKHAIVRVPQSTIDAFGVNSFPSAFLIAPNGRIVWSENPATVSESLIESLLEKVSLFPGEVPAKLSAVEKAIEKDKLGDALAKVTGLLSGASLTEEERPVAERLRDWIQSYAASGMDAASKDLEAGRVYEAWIAYEELAQQFKGAEAGTLAAKAATDLLADKDRKREVDAGKKLDKLREQTRGEDEEKSAKLFQALAKKYEGTKAGARAAEIAKELDPTID